MLVIDPSGQRQMSRFVLDVVMMIVLPTFCISGTTMFAEPTVPEIEEMGRLMHLRYLTSGFRPHTSRFTSEITSEE